MTIKKLIDPETKLYYEVDISETTALDRLKDSYLKDIMLFSKQDVATLLGITTKTLDLMLKKVKASHPNIEFYKTPSGNKRFNKIHIDKLIECSTLNQETKSIISLEQAKEDNTVDQRVKKLKRTLK